MRLFPRLWLPHQPAPGLTEASGIGLHQRDRSPGSLAAFARELVRLLFDRGEQRGPVRAERAGPLSLQAFGEGVGVDSGVGYRGDGAFRRRIVRLEALVQASVVREGEQRLFRDGVDGVRSSEATQVVGV